MARRLFYWETSNNVLWRSFPRNRGWGWWRIQSIRRRIFHCLPGREVTLSCWCPGSRQRVWGAIIYLVFDFTLPVFQLLPHCHPLLWLVLESRASPSHPLQIMASGLSHGKRDLEGVVLAFLSPGPHSCLLWYLVPLSTQPSQTLWGSLVHFSSFSSLVHMWTVPFPAPLRDCSSTHMPIWKGFGSLSSAMVFSLHPFGLKPLEFHY